MDYEQRLSYEHFSKLNQLWFMNIFQIMNIFQL
jgi:hypothetical protein